MLQLTLAVARQALTQAEAWHAAGLDVRVSFNVSPPELLTPAIVAELSRMLQQLDLPAGTITVEVTEDAFLVDQDRARDALEVLVAAGAEVAIDDYGSGYSSLSYLRDLPVHELKLDGTFTVAAVTDPRSATIMESTAALARALGMRMVVEGVEDDPVLATALAHGADLVQGYALAAPDAGGGGPDLGGREGRGPAGAPVASAARSRRGDRHVGGHGEAVLDGGDARVPRQVPGGARPPAAARPVRRPRRVPGAHRRGHPADRARDVVDHRRRVGREAHHLDLGRGARPAAVGVPR